MIKVYIQYRTQQCSAWNNHGKPCQLDFSEGMARDIANDNCEMYEPEDAGPGVISDYCRYLQVIEHSEYKEARSFEIVKDPRSGYVSIGNGFYELQDVDTVKVDYGSGWVLEWGEEEKDDAD